jgi:hypothetical protein
MSSRWKKIIKPYFIVRESKDIEMTPTIHSYRHEYFINGRAKWL